MKEVVCPRHGSGGHQVKAVRKPPWLWTQNILLRRRGLGDLSVERHPQVIVTIQNLGISLGILYKWADLKEP